MTNIVHHEVSEPDNDYYNEYYGLKRDRAGPYSPPSPCYSKYMEQNEPSQTTVPETPSTPIIQPAPPPREPKKIHSPIKFPAATPQKSALQ